MLKFSNILFCFACQVTVIVDPSEPEEFEAVASKPLKTLPNDSSGQTFVAFKKPDGLPATGKFSNLLKFVVKEVLILPNCQNFRNTRTPFEEV